MDKDRDYLYHCNGCHKADENYPDKKIDCEDCSATGTGIDGHSDCYNCGGYGRYTERVSNIEYHKWARNDAYGYFTGLYCEKCYQDPTKYTYRKDRYFDEGYAGENLEGDY